jgi:hypothetical protein
VEVGCPRPCTRATGVTTQESSPCYWFPLIRNSQIHHDLGVPMFADHIRAESFDSKLADVENPFIRQLHRHADRKLTRSPDAKAKASRDHRPRCRSRLNKTGSALISRAPFGYPDRVFRYFSLVVRLMPEDTMQRQGSARTPFLPGAKAAPVRLTKIGNLQFATKLVSAQNPHKQPKFIPPIIRLVPPRHWSLVR